jgi:hypothetical protein
MKDTNTLPTNPYTEMLQEDLSSTFVVKPFHIIFTAMLLVAWAWLGTIIIN